MIALLLAASLAAAPAPRLGADVRVEVPTGGTVVAIAGDVSITSEVHGDVVALAGSIELGPGAVVHGDAVALGGAVGGTGAVRGRRVDLASPTGLRLADLTSPPALGLALVRVGGWTLLATLVLLLGRPLARRSAASLAVMPLRTGLIGVLALASWLALAVLALAASDTPLGVLGIAALVAVLLAAKVVGLTAVAWTLGRAMSPLLPLGLRAELPRTGVAMLALALTSLLPLVGGGLWVVANVAAFGAVVTAVVAPQPMVLALARAITR